MESQDPAELIEKNNEKKKLINKSEELSDPVVRKLVYGQYRQMLRNHKN